ncbi:MAG: hypothetical protein HOG51_11015, partial [Gammaproteobacteria bacterium]|nr:hypothetical protein [Gammaproteobacteria bacterium]
MELGNNTASSAKANDALEYVRREFAARILAEQATCEGMPTVWVDRQD